MSIGEITLKRRSFKTVGVGLEGQKILPTPDINSLHLITDLYNEFSFSSSVFLNSKVPTGFIAFIIIQ